MTKNNLVIMIAALIGALTCFVFFANAQTSSPLTARSEAEAEAAKAHSTSAGMRSSVGLGTPTAVDRRPLAFIENKGQFHASVKFQAGSDGKRLWLTDRGIVYDFLRAKSNQTIGVLSGAHLGKSRHTDQAVLENPAIDKHAAPERDRHVIYQDFVGANGNLAIETKDVQQGTYNYLAGSDPSKWQTQARGFSEITYHNVWSGVDLRLYGNGPNLEQEFIVEPGANVSQLRLAYKGIKGLEVAKDGSLLIRTAAGEMRETAPRIYQEIAGCQVPVAGRFRLLTATSYTFEVSSYNAEYAMIIDPTLLYSTFLGGSAGNDTATGIAVDQSGDAYVTGFTASSDFPTTPGAFQTGGVAGIFVTKLNPTGSALVYSTYLNAQFVAAISVDRSGNAYVAGNTPFVGNGTVTFPTTPNAYSQSCNASGFLTVLNQSGTGLVYSTCFGERGSASLGFDGAVVASMTTDAAGHAFMTGYTNNPNFPTTPNAYQPSFPGARSPSAFVIALDTAASGAASLTYSTFFGIPSNRTNSYGTVGRGIALDSFGNAYITGFAGDSMPVTPGAFQSSLATGVLCNPFGGVQWVCPDAFVAKLNPSASGAQSLIYSTYLGGAGIDIGNAIAVDGSGNAYVTGTTQNNFPVTPGSFQSNPPLNAPAGPGFTVAFVAKLNAGGSQLVYSTYLGGVCADVNHCILGNVAGNGIAVDSLGNAYVTGGTNSTLLPVTSDAFQSAVAGNQDAFLVKLSPTGASAVYFSYLGGLADDLGTAIAVDQVGDAYLAGQTASGDFPTRTAFQPKMNGSGDAFVSKFSVGAGGPLSIIGVFPSQGGNTGTITPTIIGTGFHFGATATLNCAGSSSIPGSNAVVNPDGRTIAARFSLVGQAPGLCSVTIANLDGASASQQSALTVLPGGSEDIQLDVFGFSKIRGGTWTTYSVGYNNRGTDDSLPFRLWVSFDSFLAWSPPPDRPPASMGQLNGVIYIGFDIPSVPAGSSGWIPIRMVAPSTPDFAHRPFKIQVWGVKK